MPPSTPEIWHYLCSYCNHIFNSRHAIDRTREVRCPNCADATPWDDVTVAERLRGITT